MLQSHASTIKECLEALNTRVRLDEGSASTARDQWANTENTFGQHGAMCKHKRLACKYM